MPACRQMSLTGTPASACLRIETIWVSVKRDFFMQPPGWGKHARKFYLWGVCGSGKLTNVTIQAAENTTAITETQRFRQSGLNVSLTGGAVSTAMAVAGSVQRAGEVQDDRLAALHVARAGQTLFSGGGAGMDSLGNLGNQASQGIADARNGTSSGSSGLSLRIGIGASSSDSRMDYSATTSSGRRIASAGDAVIQATGDGAGNGGDVTITGSRVEGDNVTLAAARDLLLQSQQETSEQIERNQASSGEIGVTIGSEAGIGVYVSASGARGRGDGSGTTHAETTIDAANTLTLISGRDTTLEGAQARGNTVLADIGGNLTLTSQQDTSEYERRDRKLPRQAGISKVELPATRWRYSAGGRSPSESWGRSSLYSSIHQYAASRTSSRRVNRCWSRTSSRKV